MTALVRSGRQTTPTAIREMGTTSAAALDHPALSDFIAPFFFFACRHDAGITSVSNSIEAVLGYTPAETIGARFSRILCPECLFNTDDSAFRQLDYSHFQVVLALRSVRDRAGNRRILAIQTSRACKSFGGHVICLHNFVQDVTESVETYARLSRRMRSLSESINKLSLQELRVAERIRQGRMNREIADELQISERTIDRRRATILKRLDVSSTAEMIAKFVERSMLQDCINAIQTAAWFKARNAHLAAELKPDPRQRHGIA